MNSNEPPALPPSDNPDQTPNDDTQPPPFLPKFPSREQAGRGVADDPHRWLKWILEQNPFYIASAIMLLYAMFRLSTDSKMFGDEISQLFFNFGSFQVYELMLAVTAVVLVRRKILYDFSLLVCIESMFAYVPFILITQATLINDEMALGFSLSLSACLLVILRFAQLKKHFQGMNFRPRLLLLGGVLLCVNVILPLLVRYIHMKSEALNRDTRMNPLLEMLWLFGAPMLAGMAYFLPAPQRLGSHLLQRRTFPLTALSLWVFTTCAHLYAIGYIHGVAWSDWYVIPVLWTAVWMFYLRRDDVFERISDTVRNCLLLPPVAITLLAAYEQQWTLFFTLNILNAVSYGRILVQRRSPFAFQLMSLSVAGVVAGMPHFLLIHLGVDFDRRACMGMAFTGFVLFHAILSRSPKAGLIGAVVAACASGVFFRDSDYYHNVAMQVGAIFLLVHSLRWDSVSKENRAVRMLAAGIWVAHSIIWTAAATASTAMWVTGCFALTVFAIYCAVRMIFGAWGPRVVPYAAGLVLLSSPVQRFFMMIKGTPMGVIVLVASFGLFALGTILALTRHRWQKAESLPSETPTK